VKEQLSLVLLSCSTHALGRSLVPLICIRDYCRLGSRRILPHHPYRCSSLHQGRTPWSLRSLHFHQWPDRSENQLDNSAGERLRDWLVFGFSLLVWQRFALLGKGRMHYKSWLRLVNAAITECFSFRNYYRAQVESVTGVGCCKTNKNEPARMPQK
jgi:hypothetical protein